ncbi:MAG: hypothetical protein FJX56_07500 [Alphaproteobacteria bacterium]|nr:hypothetical protein [Alphaproteobacteria bacterium]
MIELYLERWMRFDGCTDHRWSVWHDGRQVGMGGPHPSAATAEGEGLAFCRERLLTEPDRISRL